MKNNAYDSGSNSENDDSLGPVYISLYAFHLGQIISTVLG